MDYVRLGQSGLRVSRLCLGMMSFGSRAVRPWVMEEEDGKPLFRLAVEQGINFFDTADTYSNGVSEEITGNYIREFFPDREDAVVATKCFLGTHDWRTNRFGLSRKHILAACDASLKRLGLDYIDLYQIHRFDQTVPMEETLEALHDLVRAGKVRYLGASSMMSWQFAKYLYLAQNHGWTRFVSMQNHYNLVYREEEREMLPLCQEEGIGVIPWSPLARGYLTRQPDQFEASERSQSDGLKAAFYQREKDDPVVQRNCDIANELGVKPAQVALAWVLQNPLVTSPIVGASKLAHLEDALAALQLGLEESQVTRLEELYQPHAVSGH